MIADRGTPGYVGMAGTAATTGIAGTSRSPAFALLIGLSILLAACSSATTPAPSAGASSATSSITSAEEAAAAVAATNPRFEGIEQKNPDMIGQGSFWEASPVASGAYQGGSSGGWQVTYTIGWGDCPAGCIYNHVWTYEVGADGTVTLKSETGDPLESGGS